jgi:cutinase
MSSHIETTAANCPNTRFILGGYSLGAAVTFQVLNNGLSPGIDQRVIGVATFGNASRALTAHHGSTAVLEQDPRPMQRR